MKIRNRASQIRQHILRDNIEHCKNVTPEQMESLIELFEMHSQNNNEKLLTIELQDETSVPRVFYKGAEVKYKSNVFFDWETSDGFTGGGLGYAVEHREGGGWTRVERRVGSHALD